MKHRPLLLTTLLLLCVVAVSACVTESADPPAGSPSPDPTSTPQPASTQEPSTPTATLPGSVPFDVVCDRNGIPYTGVAYSGSEKPSLLLLTADDIELIELCSEKSYETGAIDFSTQYVIGVFRGRTPHGGLGIIVQGVSVEGDKATIVVRLTEPTPGTPVIQAVIYPYQVIAIDKDAAAGVSAWEMVTTGGRKLASLAMPSVPTLIAFDVVSQGRCQDPDTPTLLVITGLEEIQSGLCQGEPDLFEDIDFDNRYAVGVFVGRPFLSSTRQYGLAIRDVRVEEDVVTIVADASETPDAGQHYRRQLIKVDKEAVAGALVWNLVTTDGAHLTSVAIPPPPTEGQLIVDFDVVSNGSYSCYSPEVPSLVRVTGIQSGGFDFCEESGKRDELNEIDFDTNYVIGVFRGELPWSLGARVDVQYVSVAGDTLTIVAALSQAAPGIPSGGTPNHPYQLITVDRDDVAEASVWEVVTTSGEQIASLDVDAPARTVPFEVVCGQNWEREYDEPFQTGPSHLPGIGVVTEGRFSEETCQEKSTIDFGVSVGVMVGRGQFSTGGYSIAVEEVRVMGDAATVVVSLSESPPGIPRAQLITFPYQLVTVDREEVAEVISWNLVSTDGVPLAYRCIFRPDTC